MCSLVFSRLFASTACTGDRSLERGYKTFSEIRKTFTKFSKKIRCKR